MSWDSNIYYSPEKHGLTPVAEIEYSTGSYEFDTRVVWRHKDGTLYTMRDSGCSCPTPFEDYNSLAELDRLDYKALEEEVAEESHGRWHNISLAEGQDFLVKVREAMGIIVDGTARTAALPEFL